MRRSDEAGKNEMTRSNTYSLLIGNFWLLRDSHVFRAFSAVFKSIRTVYSSSIFIQHKFSTGLKFLSRLLILLKQDRCR